MNSVRSFTALASTKYPASLSISRIGYQIQKGPLTMRFIIAVLMALISTNISIRASNAGAVWNMNGSSCRANDTAIQGNSYATDNGVVDYRSILPGATTSTITMYCPVLTVGQDPHTGDGSTILSIGISGHLSETGTSITAQLIRLSKTTGGLSNVGKSATLTFISPGPTFRKRVGLTHQFDFTMYFYYVRVDISRTSSDQIVPFYVVDLST